MNRDEKAAIVEELSGKFANAKLAVVTDYRGLTVKSFQELRSELRKSSAEVKVAKNTLLKRAIQDTPFAALEGALQGTSAVTVTDTDPVAPAKILVKFNKDNPQLAIKTAILDGKVLTADDLIALSKLPGREELLAKLLFVMQAVPTNFVQVLSGVPRKALYLLQAIKEQKEQSGN